jgi:hypothetical protein
MYQLESLNFLRHAGLDPASTIHMVLIIIWIPAFAGMTIPIYGSINFNKLEALWTVQVLNVVVLHFTFHFLRNRQN